MALLENLDQTTMPDGVFCIPMQTGLCVQRPFDAIYSVRCPLAFDDLQRVTQELNQVVAKAFPLWLRALPFLLIFSVLSGAESLVMLGFGLFVGGMISLFLFFRVCDNKALEQVRGKLSELNARYQSQGIVFDLHELRTSSCTRVKTATVLMAQELQCVQRRRTRWSSNICFSLELRASQERTTLEATVLTTVGDLHTSKQIALAACMPQVPLASHPHAESACRPSVPGAPMNMPSVPERPEVGDLVVLGPNCPPEFRCKSAVVTKVDAWHCTVAVLDGSCRFGIGECWPCLKDVDVKSCSWRLGSRVVIAGLRGAKTHLLNSRTGTIVPHKREGHPTFIRKPADPERPQLTLCVSLDGPSGGEKTVLLEPRFLISFELYVGQMTSQLGTALTQLGTHQSGQ